MSGFQRIALAAFAAAAYWLYSRFWFVKRVGYPDKARWPGPVLFAHWHGDELVLVSGFISSGLSVMASRSQDGEVMARMLGWLGLRVVRGSSSKGGAAGLKGLLDQVRKGHNASLAVDGPRGPLHRVKLGIVKLAQWTGAPIVPMTAAASRKYVFKKAWNQCYLPLPFSRCWIAFGEPIGVPRDAGEDDIEKVRQLVETRLIDLKRQTEALVDKPTGLFVKWQASKA